MGNRDLDTYPSDLRPFVAILFQNEDRLSDGYGYYCGSTFRKTITRITTEMCDAAHQLPEVTALFDAMKEIAGGSCCQTPGCCIEYPKCTAMTARAAIARFREATE